MDVEHFVSSIPKTFGLGVLMALGDYLVKYLVVELDMAC
ncbi:hypothetical protein HHE06_00110 [Helicobacter heilmannii]|nr:hypothetical protein HHE06_00110 [Helicobacter heilmannii]